jgi:hypothetical protein
MKGVEKYSRRIGQEGIISTAACGRTVTVLEYKRRARSNYPEAD